MDDLAQLAEVHLELGGAMRELSAIVGKRGVGGAAKPDQFVARAVELRIERLEVEPTEDPPHVRGMVGIFRTDEQVNVHEARPRRDIEA
ncbi:hypothetical protein D9M73_290450 [compost metagenome]